MEYNMDLFDKFGVPYPPTKWDTADWTWDYVKKIAPKFNIDKNGDGKKDQWGIDSLKTPLSWPWYWGGEMVNDELKATIDTPANRKAFEYMVDMYRNILGGSFYSGTAAMGMQGSWNLGGQFKPLKFRANVAPAPKGTHAATVQYVDGMGIHRAAKNKKGAWRVIEWLLKGKHDNELSLILDVYGWTPALQSSKNEWESRQRRVLGAKAKEVNFDSLWEARSYGVYPWETWHSAQPDYQRIVWGDTFNDVLRGRRSVDQWLKEAQKGIDALVKNRKGK
jgi:ABC-type glycerol-3-phosphate transport system substrate-binding protein